MDVLLRKLIVCEYKTYLKNYMLTLGICFYCLLFHSIYVTSIVTSVLHSYIHTSLLSGPAICICTLTIFYYVWMDIVFLLDLLLRVRVSLRLPYLVTSVLAHVVVCVRRVCFGVNDCF